MKQKTAETQCVHARLNVALLSVNELYRLSVNLYFLSKYVSTFRKKIWFFHCKGWWTGP
jgi:hypothetical protein